MNMHTPFLLMLLVSRHIVAGIEAGYGRIAPRSLTDQSTHSHIGLKFGGRF
jgi:hypothetical protein